MVQYEVSLRSPLELLISYHRLLRLLEEQESVLDEQSTVELIAIILDRIRQLELPAAVQLDEARRERGCAA